MNSFNLKKLLFFILPLFLLFDISTYGQWNQLYPPEDIYIDVDFHDEYNGYLISTFEVYKTIDGGLSWSVINIPNARSRMNDILMVEENTVWITTDDNGSFHVGGTMLKSVDGGVTWETKFDVDFYGLKELFFLDEDHGWVTTDYKIVFKTMDGGETWFETEEWPMNDNDIRSVYFTDENTGWICGGNMTMIICKTTDGGLTWHTQFEVHPFSHGLWDIEFIDDEKGFVCSKDRTLLMTENGGDDWKFIASSTFEGALIGLPSDYAIHDIEFIDQNRGWIAGGGICGSPGQFIMSTDDVGDTWQMDIKDDYLPQGALLELDFNETGQGYATGFHSLLLKTQIQVSIQENKEDYNPMICPNPFSTSTTISCPVEAPDKNTMITIHNFNGQKIKTLVDMKLSAGTHQVVWDGTDDSGNTVSNGIYFCKMECGEKHIGIKKIILVK